MRIDTPGGRKVRRDAELGSEEALSCAARGRPRANHGAKLPSFASSTSSAPSTYPSLLSSRIRCNLLKTSDGRASYPSLESDPIGGVVAARWPRETVSRTASQRSKIPLSKQMPAKEPSR
jgi:hypothetical protein